MIKVEPKANLAIIDHRLFTVNSMKVVILGPRCFHRECVQAEPSVVTKPNINRAETIYRLNDEPIVTKVIGNNFDNRYGGLIKHKWKVFSG